MTKRKRTNYDLQNTTQKTKDPHQKPVMNAGAPEGSAVPVALVAPVV